MNILLNLIGTVYDRNLKNSNELREMGKTTMTKGVILYQSKYGATKTYVDWLIEATNFDCFETKKADIQRVKNYDMVILGGGIYASNISGLSFLKKQIELLKNKQIVLFCVGASPYEKKTFQEICEHNLKSSLKDIPCFYCRGIWDEEALSFMDRTLCKMLQKSIDKKDPTTLEPWEAALMSARGHKCDWTEKKYLVPLLEWIHKQ
ncbi:MAG: flavodoxin domain-containing protein [Lachnospiraceae bacterium]